MIDHDSTSFGIDGDRLTHSREVGRLAAQLAGQVFSWDEARSRQMFLLGLVHDCGYEFAENPLDHPVVGGELLKEAGFSLWREVRWHGVAHATYYSDELLLLNIADMLVSRDGTRVTLAQRLDDIEQRYGFDSEQLMQAKRLVREIDGFLKSRKIDLGAFREFWNAQGL